MNMITAIMTIRGLRKANDCVYEAYYALWSELSHADRKHAKKYLEPVAKKAAELRDLIDAMVDLLSEDVDEINRSKDDKD